MDLTLEQLITAIGASKLRAATYLPHKVAATRKYAYGVRQVKYRVHAVS